jgi:hypothetical protein
MTCFRAKNTVDGKTDIRRLFDVRRLSHGARAGRGEHAVKRGPEERGQHVRRVPGHAGDGGAVDRGAVRRPVAPGKRPCMCASECAAERVLARPSRPPAPLGRTLVPALPRCRGQTRLFSARLGVTRSSRGATHGNGAVPQTAKWRQARACRLAAPDTRGCVVRRWTHSRISTPRRSRCWG